MIAETVHSVPHPVTAERNVARDPRRVLSFPRIFGRPGVKNATHSWRHVLYSSTLLQSIVVDRTSKPGPSASPQRACYSCTQSTVVASSWVASSCAVTDLCLICGRPLGDPLVTFGRRARRYDELGHPFPTVVMGGIRRFVLEGEY